MSIPFVPFSFIILLPFVIALLFYKFARRVMWIGPLIVLVIMSGMFLESAISFNMGDTFSDRLSNYLHYYLHTDNYKSFYSFYAPPVIASIIFTLMFYIISFFREKRVGTGI